MARFYKDEIINGCVTGIEKYGIFVSLDEYYSGLIHISEITDGFVKDINNYVNIGETIRVRVIDSDDDSFHVRLSIKDLNYKLDNKNKSGIVETKNGYNTLEYQLEKWIKIRKNQKNDKTL
ncbi:MAG: S1 RNA-binding domain-containing protein [Bacilli bacterium]|nr:S1 RNA-binding domain-containing protein [Bacilli bacterium]